MAVKALVNARTVQAAASQKGYEQGEAWYEAGFVSDLEDADGGAVALVSPEGEAEREVWVGVEGSVLAAECDCVMGGTALAGAEDDDLCAHAVAVALAALDAGIRWTPVAPRRDTAWADPMQAFDALNAEEKTQLLHVLLREQPELRERAWQLAVSILDVPSTPDSAGVGSGDTGSGELRAGTAASVEEALRALDIGVMRAAVRVDNGGSDASDAAAELVEGVLEPYERDISRRLGLGLVGAAQAVALGVLDGLSSCEGCQDREQVLYYAGENLPQAYGGTAVKLLRKAGVPLPEDV